MSMPYKLYYNHIPKTGGMYVIYNLENSFSKIDLDYKKYYIPDLQATNIEDMSSSDLIQGHFGIEPHFYIPDLTTVVTIRNPITRLISNYSMSYTAVNSDTMKNFDEWLFNDDKAYLVKNNMQSRFLINSRSDKMIEECGPMGPHTSTEDHIKYWESGFGIGSIKPDYDTSISYLNSCELVMTTENLVNDINKFFNIINKKWGISLVNEDLRDPVRRSTNASKAIQNNLTERQKDKIISLNEMDMAIWEYSKKI